MKQVTRCYNCKNIIRIAGSFKAEIEEVTVITDQFGMSERKLIKSKITLCRKCAANAGYKVKPDYDVVFSPAHDPNNPFIPTKPTLRFKRYSGLDITNESLEETGREDITPTKKKVK